MKIFFVLLFFIFLLPTSSTAFDRFDIVTTEQLREMLEARDNHAGEDFLLVNTLDEIIYRNEHIPGSVNLPWSKVATYESVLGDNKDKSIIFY